MLKNNNVVLTREQLAEAKQLHSDSYNEYLERKRKLYAAQDQNFLGTVIFLNKVKMLTKAKTMKQCVREVLTKKTGEENGI